MKRIEAFKCELTGGIYEDQRRAVESEFKAMMKRVGGSLPSMGSISADSIMECLASSINSEIYPTVIDKLQAALNYYQSDVRPLKPNFCRPAAPVSDGDMG